MTAEDQRTAPSQINAHIPNAARIYDWLLGGKDHYPADRDAGEQLLRVLPFINEVARHNRYFLGRAIRHLTACGVTQFLDLGSGLPTVENVHQIAQRARPESRVVYVDIDPVAAVHARALLAGDPGVAVLEADIRDPRRILHAPEVRDHLDFSRPIAVITVAVLHFISNADDPAGILAAVRDAVVPGSALVVSHGSSSMSTPEERSGAAAIYARSSTPVHARTDEEILALAQTFGDLEEPGLVEISQWRPDSGELPHRAQVRVLGGVARRL
ncbi:SAM-dependent methyltransferase [Sinosporangium siamense]|uniref:S-adenosyl methyltransferase n=1 Tax=Sinosporangium siamense TaxID=1367973 RepID=A0A919RIB6_9ACTN|nr:SAM-dependent methyltransferase [Sinosporangium siamense]GII94312.1 hypothetical protein Ssi02_45430 [Sinosporangium siamense]